jgi:hypothetical protein
MSNSWEPLPSIYRSKQEFLASLPPWRRLLQTLNWRPVVDLKERRYALEQRILQEKKAVEQLKNENARLAELDSKLDALLSSSGTSSTPVPSTPSEPES